LTQKEEDGKIKDVCYAKATKGDCVQVPPLYGHVTVDTTSRTLKMGNWISKECQSDYKSIETKRVFSYYYTQAAWIKNRNYKEVPKLRSAMPLESMPTDLDFLKQPKTK
jgi:glucose-6-phosphate isomerase